MKICATLIHFYETGKSEKWPMPNIPNKGDWINLNEMKKIVTKIEYNIELSVNGEDCCNVFIHTESIYTYGKH